MAYLTFHKWLVLVFNIHNDIWMVQTKTSHLGKVSYVIILLGWRYRSLWDEMTPTYPVDNKSYKSGYVQNHSTSNSKSAPSLAQIAMSCLMRYWS